MKPCLVCKQPESATCTGCDDWETLQATVRGLFPNGWAYVGGGTCPICKNPDALLVARGMDKRCHKCARSEP